MFVTILTIIYSAIALFILVRFIREKTAKMAHWTSRALFKRQDVIYGSRSWRKSNAEDDRISDLRTGVKA